MAIFPGSAIPSAAGDYTIDYSCRFNRADNSYLSWTPSGAGSETKATVSVWVKPGALSGANRQIYSTGLTLASAPSYLAIELRTSDMRISAGYPNDSSPILTLKTNAVFRDPSAWYHIVVAFDTTDVTASDRVKLYVNGERVTSWETETTISSADQVININQAVPNNIGRYAYTESWEWDGYMAEFYKIDGTAYTPSDFGETNEDTNQWIPKDASGLTFGTNGFYLKFQDSASLGDDSSGNTNDFTSSGLAATDQMLDTPTNNFCTMNPLFKTSLSGAGCDFTEGNLEVTKGSNSYLITTAGMGTPTSGKWYYEVVPTAFSSTTGYDGVGFVTIDYLNNPSSGPFNNAAGYQYATSGNKTNSGSSTSYGTAWSTDDIIGIALDLDNGYIYASKNNTWQASGDPTSGASGTNAMFGSVSGSFCAFGYDGDGVGLNLIYNFGQDSSFAGEKTAQGNQDGNEVGDFYYTPPTGYLALCTSNLPEPAIVLPEPYFEMLTATGDGTSSKTWSGLEFQPDLVWAKDYDGTEQDADHQWMDVLRGADQILRVNLADAEVDGSTSLGSGSLRTFTSDGFTVQDGTTNNNNLNYSGDSIIAYNWKAGGTGVANTDGSISSTVSANTTSGFSMATFTSNVTAGATVGHGLTQAPEMIWSKIRDDGTSWVSGATSMADTTPWGWAWLLNHHHAWNNRDEEWNDTTPGASVFTLGSGGSNVGSHPVIAYCFHSVEGYSKIGYYYGNGNANGPFMYTGFRPSFVIFKGNGTNLHNHMLDNKRWTYNPLGVTLGPEPGLATDDAEVPSNEGSGHVDFLSNGFKIRSDNGNANDNTTRFIFIAFAESPFKYSNAR